METRYALNLGGNKIFSVLPWEAIPEEAKPSIESMYGSYRGPYVENGNSSTKPATSMEQVEKDALFHNLAKQVAETLCKKNHDYGDSFHDQYVRFGDVSTVIRLNDKIQRIETLTRRGCTPDVDESIDDTLFDIAGYAILTLASRTRIRDGGR